MHASVGQKDRRTQHDTRLLKEFAGSARVVQPAQLVANTRDRALLDGGRHVGLALPSATTGIPMSAAQWFPNHALLI